MLKFFPKIKKGFMTERSGYLTKSGFTLVEVLIAMVILVVIIGAVTLIEQKNIGFSSSGKYQTQANGLAAEGLNVIKQIADEKNLGSAGTGACKDPSSTDSTNCPSGYYYLDDANKLQLCDQCKDPANPTAPSFACPTGANVVNQQNYICANSGSIEQVNQKDFTRTIIIP